MIRNSNLYFGTDALNRAADPTNNIGLLDSIARPTSDRTSDTQTGCPKDGQAGRSRRITPS